MPLSLILHLPNKYVFDTFLSPYGPQFDKNPLIHEFRSNLQPPSSGRAWKTLHQLGILIHALVILAPITPSSSVVAYDEWGLRSIKNKAQQVERSVEVSLKLIDVDIYILRDIRKPSSWSTKKRTAQQLLFVTG